MSAQPALFEQTTCGYCNRVLIEQPEGDFACPYCKPRLRSVKTMDDWIAFHRDPSKFAALSGGDQ